MKLTDGQVLTLAVASTYKRPSAQSLVLLAQLLRPPRTRTHARARTHAHARARAPTSAAHVRAFDYSRSHSHAYARRGGCRHAQTLSSRVRETRPFGFGTSRLG
eukprot:2993345-Pleurochrysis_carterae.AAC.3